MQASLAHVNRIHSALSKKVSAGTFSACHVIYTTAWIGVFFHRLRVSLGLQGYTEKQKIATQRYWAAVGRQFWSEDGVVVDYPETFEKMLAVVEAYETTPWDQVDSGINLTEAIIDQFANAWFPRSFRWVGRQIYLALQRPSILDLMKSGRPNPLAKLLIRAGLKTYLWLQEHVIADPQYSTPELARMRSPRAEQHIDPPTATPIVRPADKGLAAQAKASGCPYHV